MTIIHSRQLATLVSGYRAGWTSVADRLADLLIDRLAADELEQ
jgi:hypothetical protein